MVGSTLIAADVRTARIKLGLFRDHGGDVLPEPTATLQLLDETPDWQQIDRWLIDSRVDAVATPWWIGSVNRPAATRLIDWLREFRPQDPVTMLAAGDLPLEVAIERPDMVGIDRLLDALAANFLRQPNRPAVVVDVGTAITVDLLSADGEFLGGAILPGIGMSARAMHQFTDLLPLVPMSELSTPPPALGTSTTPAMRSGLFWGAVGAIRELTARLGEGLNRPPQTILTGGASPAVAELLGPSAQHVPQLTLAGIAIVAKEASAA